MLSNLELYGVAEVPKIPEEVIMERLVLLNNRLKEILDVPLRTRDLERERDVEQAISFWNKLRKTQ